jgi:hypothetical protein
MVSRSKIKTPRIVSPGGGRWFAVFLLGAVLGGVGWVGFDYGREWAGLAATDTGRAVRRLRETVDALEQERDQLRRKLAALERSVQVDREATRLAQMDVKGVEEENQELEREVQFLRNLLEEEAVGALRIKDFKLVQESGERRYGYRFTVVQAKEDFGLSEGRVYVSLLGSTEGESTELPLEDVSVDSVESHKMRFRHFQKLQGSVQLPEGFSPDGVVVEVKPTTKKLPPLRKEFDWVVGGG